MSRDERRRLPRTRLAQSVRVHSSEGSTCDALTVNLSLSGLQIVCDPWAAAMVAGNSSVLEMRPGRNLQLEFDEGPAIAATTLWARRASQSEYHFGLRFAGLSDESAEQIVRILAAC